LDRLFYPPQTTVADLLAFGQHFGVKDNLNFQLLTGPWKISHLPVQKGDFQFILDSSDMVSELRLIKRIVKFLWQMLEGYADSGICSFWQQ